MNVMGIIFANDASMGDLTDKRTMASVPFGGRYRQVDFALSNMANAGIRHIGIFSRHNYKSLMNHVGSGEEWGLDLEEGGLEFLTPYATSATDSYRGKLESLYSSMDFLHFAQEYEYVVMMDTAVLSNVDLGKVIASHIESGRDLTLVATDGIANGRKQLDLALKLDDNGEVVDMAVDYAAPAGYVASMDIFVVSRSYLEKQVREHIAHNLYHMDRDLVLGQWQKNALTVNVYRYDGVALYNESVSEYFANNLALIEKEVRHDLFGANHPIFTKVRDRVPSYYGETCSIEDCIVADGCMLIGNARHSVLFRQVTIAEGADVEDCIIMNNTVVGENCLLRCVILDKDVTIRPGSKLIGTPNAPIIIKRGEVV